MKVIVVTGTGTEVGKTIVTAALVVTARARGASVAVVKPAQTGVGVLEPGDVDEVRRLTGLQDVHELARYPDPLAPATAARRVGQDGVSVAEVAACVDGLKDRDLVVVEGSGGLLVRYDQTGGTVLDMAVALAGRPVVVTRAGLGALNEAALTSEMLRWHGTDCAGLVIGSWPAVPALVETTNLSDLPVYCGAPLLGRVPSGAGALLRHAFVTQARNWIDTGDLL